MCSAIDRRDVARLGRRRLLAGGTALAAGGVFVNADAASAHALADAVYNVKDPAFGAVGNGVADDTAKIQAAVNAALANNGGTIWFPAGRYRITQTIKLNNWASTNPSDYDRPITLQGTGDASKICIANDVFGSNRAFEANGREGTKVALGGSGVASGAQQVTVPSAVASTLDAGAILAIEEDITSGWIFLPDGKPFELHRVLRVSGTTVDLDSPLIHTYTGAAKVYRMTPVQGPSLRDLQFVATHQPEVNLGVYALYIRGAANATIYNVRITNGAGGFYLRNVVDGHVADCTIDYLPNWDDLPTRAQYGYGVAVAGASANITITGLVGRGCRHVFTTLPDGRSGQPGSWGGPRNVTVVGGIGEGGVARAGADCPKAIWDTHAAGTDISFISCMATGAGAGYPGFQVRAKKVRIVDCVARRNPQLGVRVDPALAYDVLIQGGEYSYNGGEGVFAGLNTTVTGAEVHHNTGRGVLWSGGDRVHVTDCYVHDNKLEGIRDQGSTKASHVVVAGNIVPEGAGDWPQATGISSVKGPDAVIANNVLRGYGQGADGTWDCSPSVKQNNVVDP